VEDAHRGESRKPSSDANFRLLFVSIYIKNLFSFVGLFVGLSSKSCSQGDQRGKARLLGDGNQSLLDKIHFEKLSSSLIQPRGSTNKWMS
jgi:hypothetical protein